MKDTVRLIRKKFIIAAMLICLIMVAVLIVSLNIMMKYLVERDKAAACNMIANAVDVSSAKENSVTIEFDKMPQTDFEIPFSPDTVSKVIFNGIITNTTGADWYCGGSRIGYYGYSEEGRRLRFSRGFAFNKDNTSITVDFEDTKQISGNYKKAVRYDNRMYISSQWWTSSAKVSDGSDTELIINTIKIIFKEDSERYIHRLDSFEEIFPEGIPDIVSSRKCFYIVNADGENVEFNRGNSGLVLSSSEIKEISPDDTIELNDTVYKKTEIDQGGVSVCIYIDNNSGSYILTRLIRISVIVGLAVLMVLFVVVFFYSRAVARPAEEAISKQRLFVSEASHELKTPVTIISANADLLSDEIGENRWLDSIRRQSESMGRLVTGLLDLSRNDEMSSKESFKSFDLSRTVTNTLLSFDSIAYEHGKSISSEIEPDISYNGIEQKISQLVSILVDNAVKYADPETEISVKLTQAGKPQLTVENMCSDFDVSKKDMLFERFYRSDESHSGKGYGLGLPIAASIANIHNAAIEVSFEKGIVKFTINL
ncbi:MAG: HAMP domain-containing histidine kinase [Ruminococcus sp.]|nr:HAMP domain-containing histidine kinase [Ruminococcus sp.]